MADSKVNWWKTGLAGGTGYGWLWGRDKVNNNNSGYPDPPTFQADPYVSKSQDRLWGQADYLLNGLTSDGGNLSGLMGDTVSFNPLTTQYALQAMQSQLAPSYRNSQQNLTNTLEANNQLTGSTTASAFGNLEADYMAQLTGATAQAGLADVNRALANRVSLYQTGLNTVQAVGNNALQNQGQVNNFALGNYENQVAQAMMNQPAPTGGLSGALTGALGGAISGGVMSGGNPLAIAAGAGLGGYSGYSGSPGTGGQFLGAGANMYGNSRPMSLSLSTVGANQGGESIQNLLSQQRGLNSYYGYGLY